jgi:hypothetical protein
MTIPGALAGPTAMYPDPSRVHHLQMLPQNPVWAQVDRERTQIHLRFHCELV